MLSDLTLRMASSERIFEGILDLRGALRIGKGSEFPIKNTTRSNWNILTPEHVRTRKSKEQVRTSKYEQPSNIK